MPYHLLASFIRTHRERLSLSRADLARMVGVHAAQVQRWEEGTYKPSTAKVGALARALEVAPVDIVTAALEGA